MKKAVSIFAVVMMVMGMFSCETESIADTDTLYNDVQASDGESNPTDGRGRG